MIEYPKIETVFDRNDKFKVEPDKLRSSVYSIINQWEVTEKVDGTNVRVHLSKDGVLSFGGRTENAQMPVPLISYLQNTFDVEKMKSVLWLTDPVDVTLFGEGYGGKIQGGGKYRPDVAFRLFDVLVDNKWWLDFANVSDVAFKIGIKTVPFIGNMNLSEITDLVKSDMRSIVAEMEHPNNESQPTMAEGIVAKTVEPLFDKHGKRLIIKLKRKDF